jgi:hypothetical protein
VATSREKIGKTPNGGVKSVIYFLNDRRELVDESEATAADVVELDASNNILSTHYATFEANNEAPLELS